MPLLGRTGRAIGAISLVPGEDHPLSAADEQLLLSAASLVAGAIENARAHDEVRGRVDLLESLARLAETISRAETLDVLLPAVVTRAASLLRASLVQIYLLEEAEGRLRLRAAAPPSTDAPSLVSLRTGGRRGERLDAGTTLAAALFGSGADASSLLMPLLASGELLGFVAARAGADGSFGEEARDLAISLTNQTADAIKKIQLIERLTERNQLKDFFEDLGRGAPDGLAARGRKLGVDLERAHLVLWAQRFGDHEVADIGEQLERLESAVGRALAGSVCDRRDGGLRILVPLGSGGEREALARLRAARTEVAPDVVVGVSSPCAGVEAYVTGFAEALQAVSAAPVVQEHAATVTFDDLGPYKYLLRVSQEGLVRDRHADALRSLLDYDRQRQAQLVRTLEEYLRQRGQRLRDGAGAVRASEHAPPAASAHHRAHRARRPHRRLADDRDRAQAAAARGPARRRRPRSLRARAERAVGEHPRARDRDRLAVLEAARPARGTAGRRRSSCRARRTRCASRRRASRRSRRPPSRGRACGRTAQASRRPPTRTPCRCAGSTSAAAPLSLRSARNPWRCPRKSVWAVARIADGVSPRHTSGFHARSAPVAAVTDAMPQRVAPPTSRKLPAR